MTTGERVESYLLAHGFKRKNGELQGNCPWREGADSESFWVSIHPDGEHGTYKDFSHNDAGSLYELADRLGIERTQSAPAAQQTKRTYSGFEDYAAAHYAPIEAFTRLGWAEVTHQGRPALSIPTTTGTRYRFLDGAKGQPVFIHDKGYERSWYRLKASVEFAKSEGLPLVLCNGEASVAVGQWYKIPAAAQTSSGENTLKDALLGELKALWEGGRIIIALDCDSAGAKASDKLATQLMDAGFVVAVVDLGVGDKGDLCDFCGLHAGNERGVMWALLERAEFTAPTPQNAALQALKSIAPMMTALTDKLRHSKPSSPDVMKQLDQLQRQIEAVRMGLPSNALVEGEQVGNQIIENLEQAGANRGRIAGLRSGFPRIDETTGGYMPGLHVIMGATGMGKTTLAASIGGYNAYAGKNGVIMPTEMHADEWGLMAACYIAGVNTADAMDGIVEGENMKRLIRAIDTISARMTFVHGASPTLATLADTIAQARAARPIHYILVDSASNIINGMLKQGGTKDATQDVYNELQALSMRVNLPFIVTHQVAGRAIAGRDNKLANIYDGFGSSAVENYARSMTTLYRHQWYVEQQLAEPNDKFPNGTAVLRIVKLRMRRNDASRLYQVDYFPGIGFYAQKSTAGNK